MIADLFTCTVWGILCSPTFSAYKNTKIRINIKKIINICRYVLWFICFPVQNMPSFEFSLVSAVPNDAEIKSLWTVMVGGGA